MNHMLPGVLMYAISSLTSEKNQLIVLFILFKFFTSCSFIVIFHFHFIVLFNGTLF